MIISLLRGKPDGFCCNRFCKSKRLIGLFRILTKTHEDGQIDQYRLCLRCYKIAEKKCGGDWRKYIK